jgi:hypothetical protein
MLKDVVDENFECKVYNFIKEQLRKIQLLHGPAILQKSNDSNREGRQSIHTLNIFHL